MTILLVDDERYVHEEILNILKPLCQANDLNIITAENGAEGLEKALLMPPHLLITDVQMPIMNGMELSAQIQKICPDCRIVFLSNYSDKEYLRGAIQLHAIDYIDKPVDGTELLSLVQTVIEHFNKDAQKRLLHEQQIKENFNNAKNILAHLCSQILRDSESSLDFIRPQCIKFGMENLFHCAFRCLLFRVSVKQQTAIKFPPIENVQMLPCDDSERGIIVLLLYAEEASVLSDDCIRDFWKSLSHLPQITGLGVGPVAMSYRDVFHAWQVAKAAFNQLFFSSKSQIIFLEKQTAPQLEVLNEESLKKVVSAIAAPNLTLKEMDELFTSLYSNTNAPVNDIRNYFCRAAELILQYSKENLLDFHKTHSNLELYHEVWNAADLDEMNQIVHQWLNEMLKQGEGDERIVRMTSAYIQTHFNDPNLSLNSLVTFTGYSKGYLSTVFKRLTGVSINNYINKVRIDNACHLLRTTDKTLEQIAIETGFSYERYFCQVFKSFKKQTPKRYRNSLKQ